MNQLRFPLIASFAFASLLVAACDKSPTTTIHAAGHVITAQIAGTPSIDSHPTHAVIGGSGGTVTIESTRARIDDVPWTAIPADAPVTVNIRKHKVSVKAGAVTIERTISH